MASTVEVYRTVEADLFHRPLCVRPQREGFGVCDHEVWVWLCSPSHAPVYIPVYPESTNTTSRGTDRLPRATLGGSLLYWGGQTPAAQHQGSLKLFLCLFQGHGWAENDIEWGLGSMQEGVG